MTSRGDVIAQCGKPLRRTVLQAFVALVAASCKPTTGWLATKAESAEGVKWIVFYGETAKEQALSTYDLVVLDPMFKGSKKVITQSGARLCGYLSLGEIRITTPSTTGSIRPPCSKKILTGRLRGGSTSDTGPGRTSVLGEIIPAIAAKGFTGLLFDTLDTPPYLERQDPDGKRGMRQAAVELVHAIRRVYPDMLVIMNRGYDLLPSVADSLDGIAAESLLTTIDASGYRWNAQSQIDQQSSLLAPALHRRNHLPILSLDYWAPEDVAAVKEIYLRERQLGHHPYVATRMLDRVIAEPVA